MVEEGVVRRGIRDDVETVVACGKIAVLAFHGFDEAINLPKAPQIETRGVETLDVDALVKFVVLPEGTGEGGRTTEEAAVDPEHLSGVDEMALNAIAGGTTFVEDATELDDEADALAVTGGINVQRMEAIAVLSQEGKSRFGKGRRNPFSLILSQPFSSALLHPASPV